MQLDKPERARTEPRSVSEHSLVRGVELCTWKTHIRLKVSTQFRISIYWAGYHVLAEIKTDW